MAAIFNENKFSNIFSDFLQTFRKETYTLTVYKLCLIHYLL